MKRSSFTGAGCGLPRGRDLKLPIAFKLANPTLLTMQHFHHTIHHRAKISFFAMGIVLLSLCHSGVSGHSGSINLFVNPDNQIYPLEIFELPQLVKYLGIEISMNGPGFGVNFPSNGVLFDTSFSVDVVSDLMYWDGIGLSATTASFQMFAPIFDNQGELIQSPVSEYNITSSTGFQSGMTWGTYNGANFWEAHALNFLWPLDAAPGIYGTVLRIHASQHESSNPFVVPFVYDPDNQWSGADEQLGVSRMREAAAAIFTADLNLDGHVDTDDADLMVAEIVAGTNLPTFDLTDDGIVDQNDMEAWLWHSGVATLPHASSYRSGDANLDGVVDGQDFIVWNSHKFSNTSAWSQGDFNADGVTDGRDFIVWNQNKFTASDRVTFVPEPMSTLLLYFFAAVALRVWPRTL